MPAALRMPRAGVMTSSPPFCLVRALRPSTSTRLARSPRSSWNRDRSCVATAVIVVGAPPGVGRARGRVRGGAGGAGGRAGQPPGRGAVPAGAGVGAHVVAAVAVGLVRGVPDPRRAGGVVGGQPLAGRGGSRG